jgi:hypothetical protein
MPIANLKKHEIGVQLAKWVVMGIKTGIRRFVADYRSLKPVNPVEAKARLEAAVSTTRRARSRVDRWIADYDAINGAGSAVTYLQECLALSGLVTLAELNAEMASLEAQAQTLIDNNTAGWTLDQIATAIEANIEWEAKQWVFPDEIGYTDTVLLDN